MADFYYTGGEHGQILERMRDRFISSPGLVLLAGEKGSGRTSFLHALKKSFKEDDSDGCLLPANLAGIETEEALFEVLAAGFGLEHKALEVLEDLKERVEHFLRARLQSRHTVFILVDEAVRHSRAVITQLLVLASTHEGLNLLLVVAQEELPNALEHFQIQALAIDCVTLRFLLPEESIDFLQQYLQHQGATERLAPDADWTVALMNKSQGNPALLVQEAQYMLPKQVRLKKSAANFPKGHLIAFAVVVLLTALVYFYYPDQKQDISEANLSDPSAEVQDTTEEDSAPATDSADDDDSDEPDAALTDTTSAPDQIKDPISVEAATPQALAASPTIEAAVPTAPAPEESQAPHPAGSLLLRNEQVLLEKPADSFTLQIASLLTENKAEVFVAQRTAAEQALMHYYRRKTGSKVSYVVVYGDYPDKQAALNAAHSLSANLAKSSPWPRRLAEIQQELKHRQP